MTAHDELLAIHKILFSPASCPPKSDDDTLTVRMLKDYIIWTRHQRNMMFGPSKQEDPAPTNCPTSPQIAAMQQSQQNDIDCSETYNLVAGKEDKA